MSGQRRGRAALVVVALVVAVAGAGWIAAGRIRSPARVAADTAPPAPSEITVPALRRTLSTQVIVRGTVRYGDPQPVVLATSQVKAQAVKQGASTTTPPSRGPSATRWPPRGPTSAASAASSPRSSPSSDRSTRRSSA